MKKRLLCLSVLGLTVGLLAGCQGGNNPVSSSITSSSNSQINSENSSSSSSSQPISEYIPTGPVYRVFFYTEAGATKVETKEVAAGGVVAKPEDPNLMGKTFVNWYTNPACTGAPYDFNTPVNSNIVLYAKFETKVIGDDEVEKHNKEWEEKSQENHLYIHYYRFKNTSDDYKPWDIWAWAAGGEGHNFDFVTDLDGKVVYDELGGAYVDIDLTQTYSPSGWLNGDYVEGCTTSFMENGKIVEEMGFQIVLKETRPIVDSYWKNDGEISSLRLDDFKWDNGSYHIYCVENNVIRKNISKNFSADQVVDPYENDDGTNVSQANVNSSSSSYGVSATAPDFYNNAGVGYQVMLASYADSDGNGMGDIYGVTKKLNYLKNTLHINTLWLTPVQLSDSYHGYDIIDYKAVDPKFGSKESPNTPSDGIPTQESAMKDYEDLLNEAKKLGIRVVMDLVINHTSKNNVWFQKSSRLDPDYRSYYQWKNINDVSDNKYWHQYGTTSYAYYGKFASSMPELNYDYQGTRDAMVDVAKFWIDKGVSGFRIDAVKHIYMADEVTKDTNDKVIKDYDKATETDYSSNLTKNINFFKEFNARIKKINPNVMILGENFDGNAVNNVAPYYEGLDSLFDFYMYYKLSNIAMGDSSGSNARAQTIANNTGDWCVPGVLNKYNTARGSKAIESVFTSNHDTSRVMNMMVGKASNADDQTSGTVSSANAATAIERAKCYATVMTMMPGITWIYYGDELGMSSNYLADEVKTSPHVDRWYRQPYKFENVTGDNKDSDGIYQTGFSFTGGGGFKIELDEYNKTNLKSAKDQLSDPNSMLSYYSKLTELKSSSKALINGSYEGIRNSNEAVFSFKRSGNDGNYYVFVNFGKTTASISASGTIVAKTGTASTSSLGAHSAVIIKG